jgi:integrase
MGHLYQRVKGGVWTAKFTDEAGVIRRVSTKTRDRKIAERILTNYVAEVDRVRAGVVSREELNGVRVKMTTLANALEKFETKMTADGSGEKYICTTMQQVEQVLGNSDIDSVAKISRERIEKWVANEVQKRVYTPKTINHYLTAVKSFVRYLVEIELLPKDPIKLIRKLNVEIGQKKKRRALTADEVERLLAVADARRCLIYRLLLGTGLRSTELSLLTPSQVDFKRNVLTIEAAKTKNKKGDVLPMRPDLVKEVRDWVAESGVEPHERMFRFDSGSIRRSLYRDLVKAGIERVGADGRSVDVHSLRKTFDTMLAKAGVPLTTVQRFQSNPRLAWSACDAKIASRS